MKLVYACGKEEILQPLGKGRYLHVDGSVGTPSKAMLAENRRNGFIKIANRYDSNHRRSNSDSLLEWENF
jgi:hypothetical protein